MRLNQVNFIASSRACSSASGLDPDQSSTGWQFAPVGATRRLTHGKLFPRVELHRAAHALAGGNRPPLAPAALRRNRHRHVSALWLHLIPAEAAREIVH